MAFGVDSTGGGMGAFAFWGIGTRTLGVRFPPNIADLEKMGLCGARTVGVNESPVLAFPLQMGHVC